MSCLQVNLKSRTRVQPVLKLRLLKLRGLLPAQLQPEKKRPLHSPQLLADPPSRFLPPLRHHPRRQPPKPYRRAPNPSLLRSKNRRPRPSRAALPLLLRPLRPLRLLLLPLLLPLPVHLLLPLKRRPRNLKLQLRRPSLRRLARPGRLTQTQRHSLRQRRL